MELGIMTEISGDIIDRGMIAIDAKIFFRNRSKTSG